MNSKALNWALQASNNNQFSQRTKGSLFISRYTEEIFIYVGSMITCLRKNNNFFEMKNSTWNKHTSKMRGFFLLYYELSFFLFHSPPRLYTLHYTQEEKKRLMIKILLFVDRGRVKVSLIVCKWDYMYVIFLIFGINLDLWFDFFLVFA